mmetsp:Transcript_102659/g.182394  ORF Transcript_102659/g.182394 Transcript_102659/m.182394 type:complete len:81 (+) Transcript_102659:306-548(+)
MKEASQIMLVPFGASWCDLEALRVKLGLFSEPCPVELLSQPAVGANQATEQGLSVDPWPPKTPQKLYVRHHPSRAGKRIS